MDRVLPMNRCGLEDKSRGTIEDLANFVLFHRCEREQARLAEGRTAVVHGRRCREELERRMKDA